MNSRHEFMKSASGLCIVLLLIGVFVFAGCGAGRTLVLKPPEMKLRAVSVELSETKSTVSVPADIKFEFEEKLKELLFGEGGFQKGQDLKIKYRFIQFNPGNQFTRWFWGGIGNAGEGSLTIEAKYFDVADRELSLIQTEGKIGSGAFGGAMSFAIQKAAEEIADYTKVNFK